MAFDSFSAFMQMEGHGPYVWTCYGVFFLLVGLIAWLSVWERRHVVRVLQRQQALDASGHVAGTERTRSSGGFQRIPSTQSESISKS